ncbi:membrane protein [Lactobacillus delbrueckii subsp. delbrueckii DSM 20074 = JCM 1012]|nr:membrane protein [Lactobacillus delbrueckii subsp. delbrueckii DSM 20074 = JCM 1012]
MIYTFIIGFIGAPLTQSTYNPVTLLIVGAVFGLLFSLIIPKITAKSYNDDSACNK